MKKWLDEEYAFDIEVGTAHQDIEARHHTQRTRT